MNRIQLLLANPHTSGAALVYMAAKTGSLLGAIWIPAHAQQFKDTAEVIEAAAIGWGLLNAGDASQSVQKPTTPNP